MSRHAVLIFSADSLAAALLGAAVELAGHEPNFPLPEESARAALLRIRPRIVLVDCDHEEGCSENFVGPAIMTGAKVVLFRSRRTARDMSEFADRLRLVVLDMPAAIDQLAAQLNI
ncbi:MAG: hypothetical protein JWN53_897 [Gemmatimonadetes bacterium]|nr:hypothetical protein [Gemmatimonadota bacterium]